MDLIDRQAAIDVVRKCSVKEVTPAYMLIDKADVMTELMMLPSAQPEKCEDAVSREEAKWVVFCHRDHVEDQTNAIDELPSVLPSAQPDHFNGWPVWRDGEELILSIKEIRALTGLSQAKFSARYGIPQRTLESWEMGERNPPEYVLRLLQRVVMMDMNNH